jgi:monoamine oxidase
MKTLFLTILVIIVVIIILKIFYKSSSSSTSSKSSSLFPLNNKNVIIVGAGIAGAVAAKNLKDKGFNVIVLEAKNRVGGRIYTDYISDTPVELGAGWIHQSNGNPLTKLVKDFNVKTKVTDYDNNELYGNDISEIEIDKLYNNIMKNCNNYRKNLKNDISIEDCIEKTIPQPFSKNLNYALNVNLEHEYGSDIKDMSLKYYDEGNEFKGNDLMVIGYDKIVKELLKGIDVKLNQQVTDITYKNKEVIVKTNKNEFRCDYVIVTVSIGVLKSGTIKFTPPLPSEKIKSMKNINMGVLNKLVLEFPKVFWDNVDVINYVSDIKGVWNETFNLYPVLNKPILVMFTAGDFSKKMETWDDNLIIKSAMNTLQKIYGNGNIPNPINYKITRWNNDNNTLGSYSYSSVGSKQPNDRKNIASSIDNKIFFAGEATSSLYPATVHGAYLSGLEAFNQILKLK